MIKFPTLFSKKAPKNWSYLYHLTDPDTNEIRYVGKYSQSKGYIFKRLVE